MLFLISCVLTWCCVAFHIENEESNNKEIFVSATGTNVAGCGTETQPCLTLAYAFQLHLSAEGTITFKLGAGTFTESECSSSSRMFTISNQTAAQPTINSVQSSGALFSITQTTATFNSIQLFRTLSSGSSSVIECFSGSVLTLQSCVLSAASSFSPTKPFISCKDSTFTISTITASNQNLTATPLFSLLNSAGSITDCQFTNITSTIGNGSILQLSLDNKKATIDGCTFNKCTLNTGYGGACFISLKNKASFIMGGSGTSTFTSCKVNENADKSFGGCIYAYLDDSETSFSIQQTTFTKCAAHDGQFLFIDHPKLTKSLRANITSTAWETTTAMAGYSQRDYTHTIPLKPLVEERKDKDRVRLKTMGYDVEYCGSAAYPCKTMAFANSMTLSDGGVRSILLDTHATIFTSVKFSRTKTIIEGVDQTGTLWITTNQTSPQPYILCTDTNSSLHFKDHTLRFPNATDGKTFLKVQKSAAPVVLSSPVCVFDNIIFQFPLRLDTKPYYVVYSDVSAYVVSLTRCSCIDATFGSSIFMLENLEEQFEDPEQKKIPITYVAASLADCVFSDISLVNNASVFTVTTVDRQNETISAWDGANAIVTFKPDILVQINTTKFHRISVDGESMATLFDLTGHRLHITFFDGEFIDIEAKDSEHYHGILLYSDNSFVKFHRIKLTVSSIVTSFSSANGPRHMIYETCAWKGGIIAISSKWAWWPSYSEYQLNFTQLNAYGSPNPLVYIANSSMIVLESRFMQNGRLNKLPIAADAGGEDSVQFYFNTSRNFHCLNSTATFRSLAPLSDGYPPNDSLWLYDNNCSIQASHRVLKSTTEVLFHPKIKNVTVNKETKTHVRLNITGTHIIPCNLSVLIYHDAKALQEPKNYVEVKEYQQHNESFITFVLPRENVTKIPRAHNPYAIVKYGQTHKIGGVELQSNTSSIAIYNYDKGKKNYFLPILVAIISVAGIVMYVVMMILLIGSCVRRYKKYKRENYIPINDQSEDAYYSGEDPHKSASGSYSSGQDRYIEGKKKRSRPW
ncbi:hypothetical protein BLNAU_14835 [Blattamonas nauphoetae]|uniref:Uncharacterized protein n=1 Tax=Blattamonas nauphoetae TaxID=2049346 RepID=A0ABQ9XE65_9EUKA|nr:hypothetical protein BLNAU_14835 [Blattamonas nauphoetae]